MEFFVRRRTSTLVVAAGLLLHYARRGVPRARDGSPRALLRLLRQAGAGEVLPAWLIFNLLVLRTTLTILTAGFRAVLVTKLLQRDVDSAMRNLVLLCALALPAALASSGIDLSSRQLALRLRKRLSDLMAVRHLRGKNYFQIQCLDTGIDNAEQRVTQDVERWSSGVANLLSVAGQPLVELTLVGLALRRRRGWRAPALCVAVGAAPTLLLLRPLAKSLGAAALQEQEYETAYFNGQSRLVTHGEGIAFCNGGPWERRLLAQRFRQALAQAGRVVRKRFPPSLVEGMATRLHSLAGFGIVALLPPLTAPPGGEHRVIFDVIQTVALSNAAVAAAAALAAPHPMRELRRLLQLSGRVDEFERVLGAVDSAQLTFPVESDEGTALVRSQLRFEDCMALRDVSVFTPLGHCLIRNLTVKVEFGCNMVISGPNGSGKSSLCRVLAGLWPGAGGFVYRPLGQNSVVFVPQNPYVCTGTLRDQLIYPDSVDEMAAKGVSDEQLLGFLRDLELGELVNPDGMYQWTLDSVDDWDHQLTARQKQAVAFCRLFHLRPRFAVLDECTSALSRECEAFIFAFLKELGISVLSVSHRGQLWRYHSRVLKLDGTGGWAVEEISPPEPGPASSSSSSSSSSLVL